jgi:uncharacterized protein with ParB-like and HNH nuclease domain
VKATEATLLAFLQKPSQFVIDGQQCLTTVSLLSKAPARALQHRTR